MIINHHKKIWYDVQILWKSTCLIISGVSVISEGSRRTIENFCLPTLKWKSFFFQCSLDVNHYRDDLKIPWRKQLKNNWKSIDDCIFSFKHFNCFINQPGWLTIEVLYPLLISRKDFTAMHKYEEDHLS